MKIAFISPGGYMDYEDYLNGNLLGTENQIFGLSKEIAKKGHEVYILRKWNKSAIEEVENVKILSFKSANHKKPGLKLTFSKLKFSKIAAEALKKNRFDIVVVTDPFTSYSTLKLHIPKVLVTHSQIPYELLPHEDNFILIKIKNMIQRRMFNNVDIIVALNSAIKDYLESCGYKAIVIPNGVEIDKYIPNYSNGRYILFGGRLVKEKGINYLLCAYSMLNKELLRDNKLVLVGFGPERVKLEKLASKLGIRNIMKFLPWLSSAMFIKMISRCSVFVLPSLYETFGIVIVEAMACGKPVVASNIPGPQDIITHGYDGFLFEKGNVYELKRYLELLLEDDDLRKRIGKNARMTVEKKYTFEKVADQYIKLFNELVE